MMTNTHSFTKPQVFFVLGGPGAGKGTQCQNIVTEFGFIHLSAGDLLRKERNSGSENAQLINNYIKQGKIVPVAITISLIKKEMETQIQNGNTKFIIDGFPRNKDNLDGWNKLMSDFADTPFLLYLQCNEQEMTNRILQRAEQSTIKRKDDNIETLNRRFKVFEHDTMPVIEEFMKQNKCKTIHSIGDINIIYNNIRPLFAPYAININIDTNESIFTFKESTIGLMSGFGIGLAVTVTLNPWDKALYLSILHNRAFLDIRNFYDPFQGVGQSMFQRAISRGLYFPLEQFGCLFAKETLRLNDNISYIFGGTFAGIINALLLNPVSAIKYTRWSDLEHLSLKKEFISMYKEGGSKQFIKGMYATMTRDVVFGSSFAFMRYLRRERYKKYYDLENISYGNKLWIDASSAIVSTILSAPFNYVRNMQYGTAKSETKIPSMVSVLNDLYQTGMKQGNVFNVSKYWAKRLRIGWGSARVAVGMSITASCYEWSQSYLLHDSK
eukprot:540415_1